MNHRHARTLGRVVVLVRMRKAAEGAALATETRVKVTVLASTRDPVNNEVMGRIRAG